MKCEELEKELVLYGELTAAQREFVDKHLATCTSCQTLFESMQSFQASVREAGAAVPVLLDDEVFTQLVMNKVGESASNQTRARTFLGVDASYFSYAAMAASIFLVVFLGVEQLAPASVGDSISVESAGRVRSVVLNRATFQKELQQSRSRAVRRDCIDPFHPVSPDLACLRQQWGLTKSTLNKPL